MSTMKAALDALAKRKAEHRKTRADLTEMREAWLEADKKLKRLRAGFPAVAGDTVKAEHIATEISTNQHLVAEQSRLLREHQAREREAQKKAHEAEHKIAQLRGRRRDLEQTLNRSAGQRARLVRQVEQAERAADSQRDLLKQHDAAVRRINAELAGLAEPETA